MGFRFQKAMPISVGISHCGLFARNAPPIMLLALSACATTGVYRPSPAYQAYIREFRTNTPVYSFCFSGLTWNSRYRITHVSPGYERFGLAPGDLIVVVDDEQVAPEPSGYWARWEVEHRVGDEVHIRADRDGSMFEATITCGDAQDYVAPLWKAMLAASVGQWDECLSYTQEAERVIGPASVTSSMTLGCLTEKARLSGRWEDWGPTLAQATYEDTRRSLREAQAGGGVDELRASVLARISELERAGFGHFASDLRMALARPTPPAPLPTPTPQPTIATGTCFAVRPDGTLLTAAHVVDGATRIRVQYGGSWHDASISSTSQALDAAVLKMANPTPNYLSIAPNRTASLGQSVFTLGFPVTSVLGTEPKFTDGSITALSGIRGDESFLQISVPIQPGNSGGPLVDEGGEVIGIITSTAAIRPFLEATGSLPQNINWAVKADGVRSLWEEGPRQTRTRDRAAAIERVKKALCYVESAPGA